MRQFVFLFTDLEVIEQLLTSQKHFIAILALPLILSSWSALLWMSFMQMLIELASHWKNGVAVRALPFVLNLHLSIYERRLVLREGLEPSSSCEQ